MPYIALILRGYYCTRQDGNYSGVHFSTFSTWACPYFGHDPGVHNSMRRHICPWVDLYVTMTQRVHDSGSACPFSVVSEIVSLRKYFYLSFTLKRCTNAARYSTCCCGFTIFFSSVPVQQCMSLMKKLSCTSYILSLLSPTSFCLSFNPLHTVSSHKYPFLILTLLFLFTCLHTTGGADLYIYSSSTSG